MRVLLAVSDTDESVRVAECVDLVVIGATSRSWVQRLLSPSVSRSVLKDADRPVLVVPC